MLVTQKIINQKLLGCWACPGNRQTGHINHWQTQRICLSVSAVVNSPPKRKCGCLPQHFWLRFDAVAVIPCNRRCSYTLLSTVFKACSFMLVVEKLIVIFMVIVVIRDRSLQVWQMRVHYPICCQPIFRQSHLDTVSAARSTLSLSSHQSLLPLVFAIRLSTVGDRAFPVAAARIRNDLPHYVTSASSLPVFRSRLEMHLFRRSFS